MSWPLLVAGFAFWSLMVGVQAYLNGEGFQITSFGIAIDRDRSCRFVDEACQVNVVHQLCVELSVTLEINRLCR